jgi:hypothetical protein
LVVLGVLAVIVAALLVAGWRRAARRLRARRGAALPAGTR